MKNYTQHFNSVPQNEPLPMKDMVKNAAGGYVYKINPWKRLNRFLILGTENSTFYEGSKKLTLENAQIVKDLVKTNGKAVVDNIINVSDKGLAIKNDASIFALAIASIHGSDQVRKYAFDNLNKVCRTGTHLFQFAEAREALNGGWGRGMRDAVANWYLEMPLQNMLYQVLKYRQREGWSHRDLLRLSHPYGNDTQNSVFQAICKKDWENLCSINPLIAGFVAVQKATEEKEVARLIETYFLPREFIPTQFLTSPFVWNALLATTPLTGLIRNLGNISKAGLIKPLSDSARYVIQRLTDESAIKKARIHPFSVLIASKTYAKGSSFRGSGSWAVNNKIVEALDETFEKSFVNATPTNKRHILGVDVSGSMSWGGSEIITPAESAAAMALITARLEKESYIMGFSHVFKDLGITAKDSLNDVLSKTSNQNFGGTDTSVAINWAIQNHIETDVFVIYTDNETWAGKGHTSVHMEAYRRRFGTKTKLAVVAFTATNRSIADQEDALSMDFVGLSSDLPKALSAFVDE